MKNKKDLWLVAIALVSVLFLVIIFSVAGASESSTQKNATETIVLEEEKATQEEKAASQTEEADQQTKEEAALTETISENGVFTFTAEEFAGEFQKNLPQGYTFADTLAANPKRDNRRQLEILDASGTSTDIAIVFDVEDAKLACSQMALTIKEDSFADDADAILKWYLFTFLDGFTEEKKKTVYNNYLYMFDTGSQDYRVYSEENVTAMMCCETEEAGNYYYVMLSAE